jgi:hypothetical protein
MKKMAASALINLIYISLKGEGILYIIICMSPPSPKNTQRKDSMHFLPRAKEKRET